MKERFRLLLFLIGIKEGDNIMKTKMMEMGFELLTEEIVSVWKDTETETKVVVGRDLHEALKLKTPYNTWLYQTAFKNKVEGTDYWSLKNGQRKDHLLTLDMAIDLARKRTTEEGPLVALRLEEVEKGNFRSLTPEMISKLLEKTEGENEKEEHEPIGKFDVKELEDNNNSLTIFSFENQNVRTLLIDGVPWFVGKDVATILGYSNARKALKDHIPEKDKKKGVTIRYPLGGEQQPTLINESGLYRLIFKSQLPSAERFTDWVTSEVLPSLRENGGYVVGQERMTEDEYIFNAMKMMKRRIESYEETIQKQSEKIEQDRPKVAFADSVHECEGCILIGDLSTFIKQSGYENIGEKRLFKWMRENGYLVKSGSRKNHPTQYSKDLGILKGREDRIPTPYGTKLKITPMVTGKGQLYFIDKFMKLKEQEEKEQAKQKELESLLF